MRHLAWAWPLLLLAAVLLGAWALGVPHLLAPEALGRHLTQARALAASHATLAAATYTALYAVLVAASVPAGTALTVLGGAVFGSLLGGALAVTGATMGATALFLAARGIVGTALVRRHGALLARVRPRLERDGFFAVLTLRLLPFVPFWLVNLACGLAGLRLAPFLLGTALGIVPAATVLASAGAGLGSVLAGDAPLDPWLLLRPAVLLPRLGLALLAAAPILLRSLRSGGLRRRGARP
jgi:uncharacterized membrane protein YdjX (TVP38/TMEM64 family)